MGYFQWAPGHSCIEMSSADICHISAMCTSVSFCNRDRRSLHCCDASDPKHASGATTNSALKYVEQKKPKVVIMENVLAIAKSSRAAATAAGQASPDVELVLSRLRAAGYVCGYDAQDRELADAPNEVSDLCVGASSELTRPSRPEHGRRSSGQA